MSVMIGIDPHKASHMAVAIDGDERALGELEVAADRRQTSRLLAWAEVLGAERTWAIESTGGLGKLLSQELVAAGEHVVDVPPTLSAGSAARIGQDLEERPARCSLDRGRGASSLWVAHGARRRSHHRVAPAGGPLRRSDFGSDPGCVSVACGAAGARRGWCTSPIVC
jgi:transposase